MYSRVSVIQHGKYMRSEESGFESMYTKKRFKIMNFFGQQLYNLSSVATSLTGRYLYKTKARGAFRARAQQSVRS